MCIARFGYLKGLPKLIVEGRRIVSFLCYTSNLAIRRLIILLRPLMLKANNFHPNYLKFRNNYIFSYWVNLSKLSADKFKIYDFTHFLVVFDFKHTNHININSSLFRFKANLYHFYINPIFGLNQTLSYSNQTHSKLNSNPYHA